MALFDFPDATERAHSTDVSRGFGLSTVDAVHVHTYMRHARKRTCKEWMTLLSRVRCPFAQFMSGSSTPLRINAISMNFTEMKEKEKQGDLVGVHERPVFENYQDETGGIAAVVQRYDEWGPNVTCMEIRGVSAEFIDDLMSDDSAEQKIFDTIDF